MEELSDSDKEFIKTDLEGKEDIVVMEGKAEYKYQLSTKKGEDILVIRGDSLDEIFTELTEAKEKYAFTSASNAGTTTQGESTYVCDTCGSAAKLITGTNARGPWRGVSCSTGDRSHTKFLH